MDLEGKVDEMSGMLHEMKPVIASLPKSLEALESRTRALETSHSAHVVKLDRAISDLDGLGRKVRYQGDKGRVREAAGERSGWWIVVLEAMVEAPKYMHVIVTILSIAAAAVTMAVAHVGGKLHVP